MKTFDDEIVSGSVLRSVWKIAWPIALTQVISGIHGFVDQILVGHYVGADGNAGVGVSWQLFLVVIVFLSSLFHGMSIVMARYSGRRDSESVSRVAYHVLLTATYALFLLVAPLGYFLSPYMLQWVNVSDDVMPHALPYLRMCFTTSAPLFFMFLLNGAFTSTGDARTPLRLAVLTTIVNIVVSYLLIVGPGPFPEWGTAGAAIGTCVGPLPSVALALWIILSKQSIIRAPERYTLVPDFAVLRTVIRVGVPAGVQAVFLNLSGAILFGYIGSLPLSAESQAAYSICYGQLFSFVTWTGFGLRAAAATVAGQNIGAGNIHRAAACIYTAAGLGALWAAGLGLAYWYAPHYLLGLFDVGENTPDVLRIGESLLRYLAVSGVFVLLALAITGGLQGAGDTKRPMVIAFTTQIVILLSICQYFAMRGTLTTDRIWTAILIAHAARLLLTYIVFLMGRWRHINVEIGS